MKKPKTRLYSKLSLLSHKKKLTNFRILKLKTLLKFHSIPTIICHNTDHTIELKHIKDLVNKAKPFKMILPETQTHSYVFFKSTTEKELLDEISGILSRKFLDKLDINVSKNGVFSGDYQKQQTISLNFTDFLQYKGDSSLYLAQTQLYKQMKLSDFYKIEPKEKRLLKYNIAQINNMQKSSLNMKTPYPLSNLLKNQDIDSLNLWLSTKPTISDWHYDSYDNFLCMLSGTKEIRLISPCLADKTLSRQHITEPYYNQAKEKFHSKNTKEIKCLLKPNEILFIPQGWYHHIKSQGDGLIIGLSVWFNSIEDQKCFKGREDYYLRYFLLKKCEKVLKSEIMRNIAKKPLGKLINLSSKEIREFFTKIAKDPIVLKEFLFGLNEYEVEFFTSLLEEIDKKIPANRKIIRQLMKGKFGGVNSQISKKIDEFYEKFWGKVDYKYFLSRFLKKKKGLKLRILNGIIKDL